MARRFALGLLLSAAACGGSPPDPDLVPAEGPYVAVADRLTALIEHEMADKAIPAVSIALVDGERTVWARGFGAADAPAGTAATANTVYRIGSVSKLFTDIGIMQLVERGDLDLDAPVGTYLPDFRPANPFGGEITLRHLMSHRAGLTREPPVGNYFDPSDSTLAHMAESLNRTTLFYPPGARSKYSNAGIGAVGYLLEVRSGQPFAEQLERAVLRPMGLRSSAFQPKAELLPRLAKARMWTYDEREFEAPTFALGMAPAGSMYSTVHDLARFAQFIFTRGRGARARVLDDGTLEAMWEPQFEAPDATSDYGLGFRVDRGPDSVLQVSHGGAIYGFATQFAALPDERLAVAVIGTKDVVNVVMERIAAAALGLLRDVKAGRAPGAIDTTWTPSDSLARRVAGHWANVRASLDLTLEGGKLVGWDRDGETRKVFKATAGDTLVVDDELAYGPRAWLDGDRLIFGADTLSRIAEPPLPSPPPASWRGLIGEYGWDHNTLFVLERKGRLTALIEWFFAYPLTQVDDSTWRFPDYGLYPGEDVVFRRDASGRAREVRAANVVFARRNVGPEDGSAFRIEPIRPVDELRREALAATPPAETGDFLPSDLVELTALDPSIELDIRYADTTNFMGTPFYDEARAFLQRPAAEAVVRAHRALKELGYGLLIHDGYRPWYVTKMFFDGTDPEHHTFVADPSRGSRHNRGCAVDLTLYDLSTGRPVQMTGSYDEFSDRSYPYYPGGTSRQRWLRDLLRRTMEAEGFDVYEAEWWHFDYRDWPRYRIGNQVFSELAGRR
ncbi:MAG: serine hydrolase [Gemmatimonadales bacterium]